MGTPNLLVSILKTPWQMAREYYHRLPQADFDWSFGSDAVRQRAARELDTLRRDGIVLLPGYFSGAQLERLHAAFERVIAERPHRSLVDSYQNTDFMATDPVFLEAALDDLLLEIVGGYYRKPFGIGNMSALRLLPTPATRDNALWHHDTRGRQLHAMLLLDEVRPDGQRMSYLRESHHRYYPPHRAVAEGSRFENDMQRELASPGVAQRVAELAGPAGTVGLFDANGLHTMNRNPGARRDTVTFYYVSYRHFKNVTYRSADVAALPPDKQKVVRFNPKAKLVD
ncbi:MAG TPA: hypothetical protein VF943_02300 [Burkholderiales bacterium]